MTRRHAEQGIHEYTQKNTKSFDEVGFNNADALAMSQVANMNLGSIKDINYGSGSSVTFEDMGKMIDSENSLYNQKLYDALSKGDGGKDRIELINALSQNPRYKDMELSNYMKDPVTGKNKIDGFESIGISEQLEQFAAVTITYRQNGEIENHISFRATDGSRKGWQEDVRMIRHTTQANLDSRDYLDRVALNLKGGISIGGHSKGGNDAEYGYLFCDKDVMERIHTGYLFDSPGLSADVLKKTDRVGKLESISKGHIIRPNNSVIGMLLKEMKGASYIATSEIAVLNHDPYCWIIDLKTGSFQTELPSVSALILDASLDAMIHKMTPEEKDLLYVAVGGLVKKVCSGEDFDLTDLFWECFSEENGTIDEKKIIKLLSPFDIERHLLIISYALIAWGAIKTEFKKEAAEELGKIMNTFVGNLIQDAKIRIRKCAGKFEEFMINAYKKAVSWVRDFWNNCIYPVNGQARFSSGDIRVDTAKLREYAEKLGNINKKLARLDGRLKRLYFEVNLQELWNLLQADFCTGYSWNLTNCVKYLNLTADVFEEAENKIKRM